VYIYIYIYMYRCMYGEKESSIYIKAKRADFVPFFVCVLLGDGSGGVFFLVSSRYVSW
jgi:hypothetical protein